MDVGVVPREKLKFGEWGEAARRSIVHHNDEQFVASVVKEKLADHQTSTLSDCNGSCCCCCCRRRRRRRRRRRPDGDQQ